MKRPDSVAVSINLPFGLGGLQGTWEPDESERVAAWDMYVELVTRVTTVELRPHEGLLREALSSLYSLFSTTRGILRVHGPNVATKRHGAEYSFGIVAVTILNEVVRPLLARWHPLLLDYEETRAQSVSRAAHEAAWERNAELRSALSEVRVTMDQYAGLLASVAGVPPLHVAPNPGAEPGDSWGP